ncbi:MAG: hypothetical protein B0A82_05485 [Alkalinema sp. CACIAM 70d]|nr:MAG: hypothetical protein B0A82_05485 [Alkalinema sp. CACIAM 70d]
MNLTGVKDLTPAEIASLKALGAVKTKNEEFNMKKSDRIDAVLHITRRTFNQRPKETLKALGAIEVYGLTLSFIHLGL